MEQQQPGSTAAAVACLVPLEGDLRASVIIFCPLVEEMIHNRQQQQQHSSDSQEPQRANVVQL